MAFGVVFEASLTEFRKGHVRSLEQNVSLCRIDILYLGLNFRLYNFLYNVLRLFHCEDLRLFHYNDLGLFYNFHYLRGSDSYNQRVLL